MSYEPVYTVAQVCCDIMTHTHRFDRPLVPITRFHFLQFLNYYTHSFLHYNAFLCSQIISMCYLENICQCSISVNQKVPLNK